MPEDQVMKIELTEEQRDFLLEHSKIQRDRYERRIGDSNTPAAAHALQAMKDHWDAIHSAVVNAG